MILECKNLSCFYGTYQAVENVSFSINAGEYLCIVGANGSGKSTLVKTILGLNKNFTGSIIKEKKISVGYLPQQTLVQKDFPASVLGSGSHCRPRPERGRRRNGAGRSSVRRSRCRP